MDFLAFAENMGKNIGKNITKNLIGKYSEKLLYHAKQYDATDQLRTSSKRLIQKTARAAGDLISNKIADIITQVSKSSPENDSETIANEQNKEMPKEKYISPEKKTEHY